MHEMETERLDLRQIQESDRAEYIKLLNSHNVLRYCFDVPPREEIEVQFNEVDPFVETINQFFKIDCLPVSCSRAAGIFNPRLSCSA